MDKINKFKQVIDGVKFTTPQQKIVDKLLQGYEIRVINRHRMNGGEMMWKNPNCEDLQYAGKVYKAFFNVFYQIKKQNKIEFSSQNFIK